MVTIKKHCRYIFKIRELRKLFFFFLNKFSIACLNIHLTRIARSAADKHILQPIAVYVANSSLRPFTG